MTPLTLTNFLQPHRNFDPSLGEIMDRQQAVSDDLKIALDNIEKLNRSPPVSGEPTGDLAGGRSADPGRPLKTSRGKSLRS